MGVLAVNWRARWVEIDFGSMCSAVSESEIRLTYIYIFPKRPICCGPVSDTRGGDPLRLFMLLQAVSANLEESVLFSTLLQH